MIKMEIKISSNMKRILMVLAATVICGACQEKI
jgi:hypothetical protein